MTIRTRFAPSPSGNLHIGGVRTALFNYLFAKKHNGKFILRIDDTDEARNLEYVIKPIFDGLRWLGIEPDENPIYQSSRKEKYRKIAEDMLKMGLAYPDQPVKLEDKGHKPYRGTHRNIGPDNAYALYDDTGWAIRFKVPDSERIVLDDLIRGNVAWDTDRLSDPIILRSNGTATYNFATAVDDAEMKITHVIRAEEHLSNTPIQLLIMDALGHVPPFYAHLPFVCEPNSKKKLSKRDMGKFITPEIVKKLNQVGFSDNEISTREELNPACVSFYQCLGYKPAGIVNYLARLGWSLDDKTEIMNIESLKSNFGLDRINSSPAQFDTKKMLWVNAEHVKMDDLDTRTLNCMEFLIEAKLIQRMKVQDELDKARAVVKLCGDRIKCYSDILPCAAFFWRIPELVKEDFDKYVTVEMAQLFDIITRIFREMKDWSASNIDLAVRTFMNARSLKPNSMIFAIRVALCGHNLGPSLFESMELLGRDESIKRMYMAMVKRLQPFGGS